MKKAIAISSKNNTVEAITYLKPSLKWEGFIRKGDCLFIVPINFSGSKHNDCQDEEQTNAAYQKRIVFQLDDYIYEAVQ